MQLNAVKIVFHKKQRQCARPRISRKRDPFGDDEPRETAHSSDVALPLGQIAQESVRVHNISQFGGREGSYLVRPELYVWQFIGKVQRAQMSPARNLLPKSPSMRLAAQSSSV